MIASERLVSLSGLSGVSAATHLLAIGMGVTAGAALLDYSALESATAAEHLLSDAVTETVTVSGGKITHEQALREWEARRYWRVKTLEHIARPVDDVVQETVQAKPEPIEIADVLPRINEPVLSLAELLADAKLLQLEEAYALESAMAVRDVMKLAEMAYIAELAVQQEKDAIAAFLLFMD